MHNLGTIWVVVNASEAQRRLVEFIDSGYMVEAVSFSGALDGLINKMKSFVQQYGGSIPLALYERVVLSVPSSAAEQIPSIVSGYAEVLSNKIAVGMGLTMEEASSACRKSVQTGQIELFDPEDRYDYSEDFIKSSASARKFKSGVVLPPNIFDPTIPDETPYQKPADLADAKIPSIQEAMEGEAKLIEAMANQMGMQAAQEQMQQMQQQMQQPRDLLETLNGGQVEGHEPEGQPAEEGEQPQEGEEAAPSGEEMQQLESEVEEAEQITSDDKIAAQLDSIRTQIPQIMGLADKNPKAFKDTMNMINKLIQYAHKNQKNVKKSETRERIDELIKDINHRASLRPRTHGIRYPVGTRLNRFRKVLVDGKEKWREMSSGIVQDSDGNQISIKEHNKQKDANQREEGSDDGA